MQIKIWLPLTHSILAFALCLLTTSSSHADVVALDATADTTLYSNGVNNNGGGHTFAISGIANNGNQRNMLLMFDLSGIAQGATITSASLDVSVIQANSGGGNFQLFQVDTAWGEGNKTGNQGSTASAGEATWNAAEFGSVAWGTAGGSTFGNLLNQESITAVGVANFESSVNFVSALQSIVNSPSQNFGFLITSSDAGSALRFGSREGGAASVLNVEFAPVPEPVTGIVAGGGLVGLFMRRRRR